MITIYEQDFYLFENLKAIHYDANAGVPALYMVDIAVWIPEDNDLAHISFIREPMECIKRMGEEC